MCHLLSVEVISVTISGNKAESVNARRRKNFCRGANEGRGRGRDVLKFFGWHLLAGEIGVAGRCHFFDIFLPGGYKRA